MELTRCGGPEAVLAAGTGNDAMLLQRQEYKMADVCRNTPRRNSFDICTPIGIVGQSVWGHTG